MHLILSPEIMRIIMIDGFATLRFFFFIFLDCIMLPLYWHYHTNNTILKCYDVITLFLICVLCILCLSLLLQLATGAVLPSINVSRLYCFSADSLHLLYWSLQCNTSCPEWAKPLSSKQQGWAGSAQLRLPLQTEQQVQSTSHLDTEFCHFKASSSCNTNVVLA